MAKQEYHSLKPTILRLNKEFQGLYETTPNEKTLITILTEIPELPAQKIDSFCFNVNYRSSFAKFDYKSIKDINNGEWTWNVQELSPDSLIFIAKPNNTFLRKGKNWFKSIIFNICRY